MDTEQPSAPARVFAIPELLEQILLSFNEDPNTTWGPFEILRPKQLRGLRALLVNQRVNKTFRDTIKDSPSLQQALFFKQSKPAPATQLGSPAILNDIVMGRKFYSKTTGEKVRSNCYWIDDRLELTSYYLPDYELVPAGKQSETPSWKSMYLTSRPMEVTFYDITDGTEDDYGPGKSYGAEVTMGEILKDFATIPRRPQYEALIETRGCKIRYHDCSRGGILTRDYVCGRSRAALRERW